MMDDYDAKLVEEPTFISGRCQPPSMGRRCSVDRLADPMNRIRPASATDSFVGSRFFAWRVSRRWRQLRALVGLRCSLNGSSSASAPSISRVTLFARQARRADESRPSGVSSRALVGSRFFARWVDVADIL